MNQASVTTNQTDETAIRDLIAGRVTAMRAGDADRLVADYTGPVVKFDLAPPLQNSGPGARDAGRLRGWFDTFAGPVDYEVRDLDVTVGGTVAYCHSLNRLSATPQGITEPFTLWFRATVCLEKSDGVWRIAHEHNSTPFYMDGSFRAALDLQP